MSKLSKTIISYLIFVVLIVVFVRFFLNAQELIALIRSIEPVFLVVHVILALLYSGFNYNIHYFILRDFKINLKFREWYGLGCVNTFSNYIFPFKSGTLIKSLYLKNKYDFKLSHSLSILIFSHFVFFELLFLLSFILLMFIKLSGTLEIATIDPLLLGSLAVFSLGIIAALFLRRFRLRIDHASNLVNRITNIFNLFIDGFNSIQRNYRLLAVIIGLNLIIYFIQLLRLHYAFAAFGMTPELFKLALINLVYCLSSLFFLLPGNLGVQEILISLSAGTVGLPLEEGFLAASIIRVVSLGLTVILGPLFYLLLNMHSHLLNMEKES